MSFDTNQRTKLDIAFKKLLNKSTLNINDVANSEPIGTNVSISTSTIFAEAITDVPGTTSTTPDSNYNSDATVEHVRFIATAHPDSDVGGKYHAYTLSLPDTYEIRSTQTNKTALPFGNSKVLYESLGKLQLVPPSFGGSYAAKPYRAGTENAIGSGTEIPPLATEAWVIDYYSGVLYLENPTNDLITFVDAYLYIGDMADQNSSASLEHENTIVLDVNRSDTYTEDGSSERPYKTFANAWSALNTTKDTVFYFNPGTYTVNLTNADAMTNKLSFIGQSKDSVVLTPADITVDCFKLTDKTGGLFFANLTIQEAKYGIRVINGTKVTLDTVRFYKCGSDATVANHDGSKSQADQASAWSSSQLTNGGACRIENCTDAVTIKNCSVDYSLRGCRVQNCTGGGFIINNEMLRTLESAIYLASSSYDGSNGSIGFEIVNNNINEAANNGILIIGGRDNIVKDNVIRKAWNTPIMMWHTLNTIIDSNRVISSNTILHNGIGNLGDSWAQVSAAGATNIAQTDGSFVFQSTNNVFTDCGQGRLSQAYKVAINPSYHIDNTSAMNYPTNYSPLLQYSSDNDYSDLTDEIYAQNTNITRKNLVTNFNQQVADLGDINLSGLSNGDVLKYNGTWTNGTLDHTEISGLGTSVTLDAGADIDELLKIEDISGSPGLPAIDGSALTGITASQVATLATVATSGSFNDLQNTPTASTLTAGIIELATLQEVATGTDTTRAVTPAGLAAELSGVGTSDKVFEGQAKVEAFDDGSTDGAVIKFSVDPDNTGSPVDVWHIDGNGHIIPQTNAAFDLGNADKKVRHLFLSDNSIKMGNDNKSISIMGDRLNYDGNAVTTDNLLAPVATSGSYGDLTDHPTIPSASTGLTDSAELARLASPGLTGTPTAPTASPGTNTTQIATTQFVRTEVAGIVGGVTYKGTIDVADFATMLANAEQGDFYKIATGGTASDNRVYATNDSILINADMGNTYVDTKVDKIDNTEAVTSVNSLTGAITLNLDGLSDVAITSATIGEVLRYNGSNWVDAQLAYSDLSGAPTNLTDLADVNYTAGPDIDGHSLVYNDTTEKWEAVEQPTTIVLSSSNLTQTSGSAEVLVVPGNDYVIDPSASSVQHLDRIFLTLPATGTDDPKTTTVVNLSDLPLYVRTGSNNVLYDAAGNAAPYKYFTNSLSGYYFQYNKGTIALHQSDTTGTGSKWYSYFSYPIENEAITLDEGDGFTFCGMKKAFVNAGHIYGDFAISSDISATDVKSGRRYVTTYNESTDRTVTLPESKDDIAELINLNGHPVFFENRGTAELKLKLQYGGFVSPSTYYRSYFVEFGTGIDSSSDQTLLPGESCVIVCEYTGAVETNNAGDSIYPVRYHIQRGGHIPERIVETDNSGTNSTVTTGTEQHKVILVDNGGSAVTLTLPQSHLVKPNYKLTILNRDSGVTTVSRGGSSNLINDSTSVTLDQYNSLELVRTSTGWSIIQPKVSANVGDISGLATVAISGSYDDLSSHPIIPSDLNGLSDVTITAATLGEVLRYDGNDWVDAQLSYADLSGAPALATVATSGNYSDLSGTGNVVVLDSSARLPAVDASLLTNLPSGGNTSRYIHVANVTATTHTINVTANDFADHDIFHNWTNPSSGTATINLPSLSTLSIGDKAEFAFGAQDWTLHFKGVDSNNIMYSSNGGQVYSTTGLQIKSGTSAINVAVVEDHIGKAFYLSEVVPATLDLLANVDLNSIQGGQTLVYNATSSKWENTTLGTASTAASTDFLSGTAADTLGGDLDVGGHDIVSSSNGAINLAPDGSGVVTVLGNATGGSGQIKLNCENNSHGVTIKSPAHSASATYTLTLPDDTGSSGEVLQTDGSGVLSWVAQSSGGGGGGSAPTVTPKVTSSNYAITSTTGIEEVYLVTPGADIDVTLASAATAGSGYKYHIKNLSASYTLTLKGAGSETIDGIAPATGRKISLQYETITVVSDGSNWFII